MGRWWFDVGEGCGCLISVNGGGLKAVGGGRKPPSRGFSRHMEGVRSTGGL